MKTPPNKIIEAIKKEWEYLSNDPLAWFPIIIILIAVAIVVALSR